VLGDASFVAPVLLFQVLVLAPVGLAVPAGSRTRARSRWRVLASRWPRRSSSAAAWACCWPRPGSGCRALKTLVQPAPAYALGRWVAGLDGVALLAVTVTSALPTAQNVFVYASTYDRGTLLARDVVLLSTVLSVPVLVGIALLLG
jgi:hypothetical protein